MKYGAFLDLCSDTYKAIEGTIDLTATVTQGMDLRFVADSMDKRELLDRLSATALGYQGHIIKSLVEMEEAGMLRMAKKYGVPDLDDYVRRIR